MRRNPALLLSLATVTVLGLAGCSSSTTAADARATGIQVVASTNVYGDIAAQIGGPFVTVTSAIDDPSQDPHSFEADAQIQLAVSKADVLVINGAGYDTFMNTLLGGAGNSSVKVLNTAKISGKNLHPRDDDFNEHLWYDMPTMHLLAAQLVATYSKLDPKNAATFSANAAGFDASLTTFETDEATLKAAHLGTAVAITEPVPLYMLNAAGLKNVTSSRFTNAVEQGTDVSPVVLAQTIKLITGHKVALLAYNEQTSSPETEQLLAAARTALIPIVPVTETLPVGKSFVDWMTENLDELTVALTR